MLAKDLYFSYKYVIVECYDNEHNGEYLLDSFPELENREVVRFNESGYSNTARVLVK